MSRKKTRCSGFLFPPFAKMAVNSALKKSGDRGVYGDLSGGLKELEKDSIIYIRGGFLSYQVSISPDSGAGHGFDLKVGKLSWRIKEDDLVYENVISADES